MNIPDSRNSLKNAEMPSGKRFLRLGYSNLGPLKSVFNGFTLFRSEAQTAALLAGCGTRFLGPGEPTTLILTPKLRGCGGDDTTTPTTPNSPTIPPHISLGLALTNPLELACAEAVAEHLSSECGRMVSVAELEGLMLYLWSENERDGLVLTDYFGAQSRPLQGLLLQCRTLEGQPEPLARAELLPFVGRRFEILAREGQRGSAEVAK